MDAPLLRSQIVLEEDVVLARHRARELSRLLGFDHQDQTRIATALSELARNAFQYAGGGRVEFLLQVGSLNHLFVMRVTDKGPGIPNLDEVLSGSYRSRTGMGVGLLGAKRLMDVFHVGAVPGGGTQVTLKKLLPSSFKPTPERIQALSRDLARLDRVKTYDEVSIQNRELMKAMEELSEKQRELNQINRELEDTNRGVVALYAELDQRAEELRRANSVKTRFLSNITHEFRSPLNAVKNLTGLLLDHADGPLSSEQEHQVRLIRKSVESLSTMVDDLLDLAKVEAGKVPVRVEKFDLREVFSSLRGLFRLPAEHPVALHIEDPQEVIELETDEGKLTQILRNFVSNAIKYTEHGSITLTARAGEKHLELALRDTGIGIPEGSREAIFEEFTQVESRLQAKVKGTGLGLPLSRKLAELLGGHVYVESELGKGSTFVLSIPYRYEGPSEGEYISHPAARAPEQGPPRAAGGGTPGSCRVLLIDDQERERYVIRSILASQYECEIHEDANPVSGLARARELKPALLVVDLVMPEMTGFQLVEEVRKDEALKNTAVVVFSGKELSGAEQEFLQKNGALVLSKVNTDEESLIEHLTDLASRIGLRRR
jgi:signal transduction histidine kinase